MQRHALPLLLSIVLAGCVIPAETGSVIPVSTPEQSAQQSTQSVIQETEDQQGVRQIFTAYKYALLNDLGNDASELISDRTARYYDQLRQSALTSDANELKEQPGYNRLVILAIRHNITPNALRKMQGRDVFSFGVKNQWVAKDAVAPFELGTINVYGNYASGKVMHGGKSTNSYLEFRKENGAWRINLVPLLERVGRERSAQLGNAADENKAIFTIIEKASGRKVDNSIWIPPGLQ